MNFGSLGLPDLLPLWFVCLSHTLTVHSRRVVAVLIRPRPLRISAAAAAAARVSTPRSLVGSAVVRAFVVHAAAAAAAAVMVRHLSLSFVGGQNKRVEVEVLSD